MDGKALMRGESSRGKAIAPPLQAPTEGGNPRAERGDARLVWPRHTRQVA
jgi:hypothetical protein